MPQAACWRRPMLASRAKMPDSGGSPSHGGSQRLAGDRKFPLDDMSGELLRNLSGEEFELLSRGSRILARDGRGVKVMETESGEMIKFFRLRRRFSSALVYPYSKRFIQNASRLKKRGIKTVDILGRYKSGNTTGDAVVYRKLPGQALRGFLESVESQPNVADRTVHDFAGFLGELHQKGVLFRSIHFGNVVVLPDGCFAVIDIADISFRRKRALSPRQRVRNFIHMSRYEQDRQALLKSGLPGFLQRYLDSSHMNNAEKRLFNKILALKMHKIYPPIS